MEPDPEQTRASIARHLCNLAGSPLRGFGCRRRALPARRSGSGSNRSIGRMRISRNPKATLFGRKENLDRLYVQIHTSLPLTVGHRGRRPMGGERPERRRTNVGKERTGHTP
jgi:hypothetical protein